MLLHVLPHEPGGDDLGAERNRAALDIVGIDLHLQAVDGIDRSGALGVEGDQPVFHLALAGAHVAVVPVGDETALRRPLQPGDTAGAHLGDLQREMGERRPILQLFLHRRRRSLGLPPPSRPGRAGEVQDQGLSEHLRKRGPARVAGELIRPPPDAVLCLHRRIEGEEQFPAGPVILTDAQAVDHRIEAPNRLRIVRAEHHQGVFVPDGGEIQRVADLLNVVGGRGKDPLQHVPGFFPSPTLHSSYNITGR